MKKFAIAAILMISFAGVSMAQTHPKKTGKAKMEAKKDSTSTATSAGASTHKHHKGAKHAK